MTVDATHTIGVVGSGIMAAGIAEVAARGGIRAIVRARSESSAAAALKQITGGLARQVDKGKLEASERDRILANISTTVELTGLADCDIVIESVVEDLATKQQLFGELDAIVKPSAILATNTSTLSVVEMAKVTNRPDKVCGIHFFNPAAVLPLVEIVRPITASDETIARAAAFVTSIGKEGVHVLDRAGFIVNALLFPYLNNAIRMLEDGTASMQDIDTAMKGGCNFPMGPFALLDLVGLDTSLSILETLHTSFGDENFVARPMLRDLVAQGRLGRKTKAGFYVY
ncbi:MAG: 3-hydroxybutyryl-CoA dehydrogenase [Actinomycetota bacterium]|jgi:3-hydroxybutyryl-CoA dehydrogenase|nr:3-hydroxybutyryl-CoA dehydrogenase [Actinomycetota bacterium]